MYGEANNALCQKRPNKSVILALGTFNLASDFVNCDCRHIYIVRVTSLLRQMRQAICTRLHVEKTNHIIGLGVYTAFDLQFG